MQKLEKDYAGLNCQENLGIHHIDMNGYFTGDFKTGPYDATPEQQVLFTLLAMVSVLNKIALINNINVTFGPL